MADSSSSLSFTAAPDGLAVAPRTVLARSVTTHRANDMQARLKRTRERLYVLCQLGGWGGFLIFELAFTQLFGETSGHRDRITETATVVMVILMGLALTHYARPFMTRWGWKDLSWRAIVPRVVAMAAVLSFLWTGLGYGYTYGVVRMPWPSKYAPALILALSWLNGIFLLAGWLCLYFFYHILDRLNRMQVEQLRLEASVKEAELRALKSQVNPHFLFNCLNSLRALIDEDAPRAREAVTRLANMLRYSLQSSQLETVPFDEELRIVEDYLALEQIRHESRLRVHWEVDDDVRSRPVPPMLLQTLVENAVKYGINLRREGGELTVTARMVAGCLHIRVTNPGDLSAPPSAAAARAGSSTGVGLRNASERLKLLFGDQATLQLNPLPGGRVAAEVCIPGSPVSA